MNVTESEGGMKRLKREKLGLTNNVQHELT